MNGMSSTFTWTRTVPVAFTDRHVALLGSHGRLDGRRVHALRPARPRGLGRPHRPGGRRRRGLATAVLGRGADAGHRAAATLGVQSGDPPCGHRARCRHRGRDPAVHGRRGPPPPGHGQRAGVPRAARGGRGAQPRRGSHLGAGGCGRRGLPDPAVGRHRGPGRSRVRPCRGGLLGGVHRAHPEGRRHGHGDRRSRDLDAGRGHRRHGRGRPRRGGPAHARAAAGRPRSRDPVAGRSVHPRAARATTSHDRQLRHPDGPGAGVRAADRLRRPAPGAEPARGGRRRPRGGGGDRCRTKRCPAQRVRCRESEVGAGAGDSERPNRRWNARSGAGAHHA